MNISEIIDHEIVLWNIFSSNTVWENHSDSFCGQWVSEAEVHVQEKS